MANKLIITESQFKRLKHLLMETPLNRFISSSANEGDLIQISVGDKKSIFKYLIVPFKVIINPKTYIISQHICWVIVSF